MVADGQKTICKFNCNAGVSVIGVKGHLHLQGHLWEVKLRFV
jgi:hypothetical protein